MAYGGCTDVLNPLPSATSFSKKFAEIENVDSRRSCDSPERFHHFDAEHASLAIDSFRDQTRENCHTTPIDSSRSTHFQISLLLLQTRQNSSQIRTSRRHKPTVATSNLHVIPRLPISTLSFSLISPARRASFAREQKPGIHIHITCIARPQRVARRAPHTHQLKFFTGRDSDFHRAFNLRGSQL